MSVDIEDLDVEKDFSEGYHFLLSYVLSVCPSNKVLSQNIYKKINKY